MPLHSSHYLIFSTDFLKDLTWSTKVTCSGLILRAIELLHLLAYCKWSKEVTLLCQRWQCQEIWKQACLGRPKPFRRRRLLFDRPEQPPAGSLPPELCTDMLPHHRRFFQSQTLGILPQNSYLLHFLAPTISSTCKCCSQKTREVMTLQKGNFLHLRTLGTVLGWDTVSQAGNSISYRNASETPKGLVSVWRGYGAALVCTSVPISACLVICHTSEPGFTQHKSQRPLAIGGAGKFLSKPAKDFCLAWNTSYANFVIQNNLIFYAEIAHCVMASRY